MRWKSAWWWQRGLEVPDSSGATGGIDSIASLELGRHRTVGVAALCVKRDAPETCAISSLSDVRRRTNLAIAAALGYSVRVLGSSTVVVNHACPRLTVCNPLGGRRRPTALPGYSQVGILKETIGQKPYFGAAYFCLRVSSPRIVESGQDEIVTVGSPFRGRSTRVCDCGRLTE